MGMIYSMARSNIFYNVQYYYTATLYIYIYIYNSKSNSHLISTINPFDFFLLRIYFEVF